LALEELQEEGTFYRLARQAMIRIKNSTKARLKK
jgi:hypothetical protein